jgi:hypothetical protein
MQSVQELRTIMHNSEQEILRNKAIVKDCKFKLSLMPKANSSNKQVNLDEDNEPKRLGRPRLDPSQWAPSTKAVYERMERAVAKPKAATGARKLFPNTDPNIDTNTWAKLSKYKAEGHNSAELQHYFAHDLYFGQIPYRLQMLSVVLNRSTSPVTGEEREELTKDLTTLASVVKHLEGLLECNLKPIMLKGILNKDAAMFLYDYMQFEVEDLELAMYANDNQMSDEDFYYQLNFSQVQTNT